MPSCWRWGAEPLCVCLEMSGLQLLAGVHAWRCWVSWVTSYFGFVCTMKLVSQTNKNWEKRQECMGNVTGVMWVGCFFGGFFCWFVPPPPPLFFPSCVFPYKCLTRRLCHSFWGYSTFRHRPRLSSPLCNCWRGEGTPSAQPHLCPSLPVASVTARLLIRYGSPFLGWTGVCLPSST